MSKTSIDFNSRKNSTFIVAAIGIVFVALIVYQFYAVHGPRSYTAKINKERSLKDLQFKNSPDSPIKQTERAKFDKLTYYPANPGYVCPATLVAAEKKDTLRLSTTTGGITYVVRVGKFTFDLQGRKQELAAYMYLDEERNGYFVPFRDLTSGVSTYGGGRYMDVSAGPKILLDFNKAYNPYCVYNETYSCPLPPAENYIALEILAGEKMPVL